MSREVPILFAAPMAQANRAGLKSETRRLIKGHALGLLNAGFTPGFVSHQENKVPWQPGDTLWVRETHWRWGKWVRDGLTKTGKQRWTFEAEIGKHEEGMLSFTAPQTKPERHQRGWHKRPSIFLPRWACRNTYAVLEVRAERLQDITDEGAIAEGIQWREREPGFPGWFFERGKGYFDTPRLAYFALFDSINGAGAADMNPLVWVIKYANPACKQVAA